MSEEFAIKFNCSFIGSAKKMTVFNSDFINEPENLRNMNDDDFSNLEEKIVEEYKNNCTLEKIVYYFKQLQSWNYSTDSDDIVKKYFRCKIQAEVD